MALNGNSTWLPLNNAQGSAPRKLTKEEIKEVLAHYPRLKQVETTAARQVDADLRNRLAKQLAKVEVCPEVAQRMAYLLGIQWLMSVYTPATPVGTRAAEAVGSLMTQLMLDTFHRAGLASGAGGVDVLTSIIRGSAVDSKASMDVHFTDKYTTYEQAVSYMAELQYLTLDMLLQRRQVNGVQQIQYQIYTLDPEAGLTHHTAPPPEEPILGNSTGIETGVSSFIRLYLNPLALYESRTLPLDIMHAYMRTDTPKFVVCAENSAPYVDVYLSKIELENIAGAHKPTVDLELWRETVAISRYVNEFVGSLSQDYIRGVPGEKRGANTYDIYPFTQVRLVREYIPDMLKKVGSNAKSVAYGLDTTVAHRYGVDLKRVQHMFQEAGLKAVLQPKYVQVGRPEGADPLSYLSKQIRSALTNAETQQRTKPRSRLVMPRVVNGAYIHYLTGNGNNLGRVFSYHFVDSDRTTSSSVHATNRFLGIECAREIIVTNFELLLGGRNVKVHPAYLRFIAEFITSRGGIIGANHIGMARYGSGHLTRAMYERAHTVLAEAAIVGTSEPINSVSASIATGCIVKSGSGAASVQDPRILDHNGIPLRNRALSKYEDYDQAGSKLNVKMVDFSALNTMMSEADNSAPGETDGLPNGTGEIDSKPVLFIGEAWSGQAETTVTQPSAVTARTVMAVTDFDDYEASDVIIGRSILDGLTAESFSL